MKRFVLGSSWHLATIAGIPIKVHWTFGLLLFFVFYMARQNQLLNADIGWFFLLVMIMFVFVIMHEFGHALTARRFGVSTRDIIISPIGGVARLESIPRIPIQELLIALAGPAVNVFLAILFTLIILLSGGDLLAQSERINPVIAPMAFLSYLLSINVILIVFNMIPAFPMDGGRVLRAILSMSFKNHLKATLWASRIGQVLATVFFVTGIYFDHFGLVFIGLFVFFTARREYREVLMGHKMATTLIKEIMNTNFVPLHIDDTMSRFNQLSHKASYAVVDSSDDVVGVIPELFINDAVKYKSPDDSIRDLISQSYGYIGENTSAQSAFEIMNEYGWSLAIVTDTALNKSGIIDRRLLRSFMSQ
jgi:Zn-dependent protease